MRPKSRRRPRFAVRFAAAAVALATTATLIGLGLSCGSDAVGIDACRQIETARCKASAACAPLTTDQVANCELFYSDECLNGIENTTINGGDGGEPDQPTIDGCVSAVTLLGSCAAGGKDVKMKTCEGTGPGQVQLTAGIGTALDTTDACYVLMHLPEDLAACAFVAEPLDGGPDAIYDAVSEDVFILDPN